MNVEETVIRIISRENHLDPGSVTPDSTFAELGIDSLDGINIVFALEDSRPHAPYPAPIDPSAGDSLKLPKSILEILLADAKIPAPRSSEGDVGF